MGISANIDAHIMNADGGVVEVKNLKLEQPDYSLLGSDDKFDFTKIRTNKTIRKILTYNKCCQKCSIPF